MKSAVIAGLLGLALAGGFLLQVEAKYKNEEVTDKLMDYAKSGTPTGLTYEDLEAAHKELRGISREQYEGVKKMAIFRLIEDFILNPLDLWQLAPNEEESVKRAYVKRVEQTFKRFWPAYMYGNIIGAGYTYNGEKFLAFVHGLLKRKDIEPTIELWHQAAGEYNAIRREVEDIIKYEDIYEQLEELEIRLNYFNHGGIKYIIDHYKERLNNCNTTEDMRPIIEDFRRAFGVK